MSERGDILNAGEFADAPASPEQRLFRHIILNAVLDAIYGATTCTRPQSIERGREEAMRWLIGGGEDFQLICECADLEPTQVRDAALAYIARERHRRLTMTCQRPTISESAARGRRRR